MDTDGIDWELDPNYLAFVANALKVKRREPDKFRKIFVLDFSCIVSRPVINKFGWWVLSSDTTKFNIPKLKLFYFLLFHHKYISCSYEEFEVHFIGDEIPLKKIIWEADVSILVLLFDNLIHEHGVIAKTVDSFYDLLFNHFLLLNKKNKRAEELKHGSLKSSLSNSKKNSLVVIKTVDNFIALLVC